ncbi:MAG: TatD family nuclease-associated radical SAM protein [Peptococcaceae bacterium]|nr:TatD family nuclease-associated radical SAM protein [Peptococcaceae bacterium]
MKDLIVTYKIGDRLYLNVTNRCTNNCEFCIRYTARGVGYNLWLEREPGVEEVVGSLGDLRPYSEIVFCGYGEPLIRMDLVKEVAGHIKREWGKPVRVNTNGHADLIHGPGSAENLKGLVDRINVSLNAHSEEKYLEICRPVFGRGTYEAVIGFAESCIGSIPDITLSVVEWPGVDVNKCREVAERLGVNFLLRRRSG